MRLDWRNRGQGCRLKNEGIDAPVGADIQAILARYQGQAPHQAAALGRRSSPEHLLEPEECRLAFFARDLVHGSAMADAIAELSNLVESFG
jgi:hypothetical protein